MHPEPCADERQRDLGRAGTQLGRAFTRGRELSGGQWPRIALVTHRFSSVRSADRIIVLERGRLVESGTHEELVRGGGLYAELLELQARALLRD